MIEYDQAVVKADLAIGQLEVIHRAARKFWFNEIFQVIPPIPEAAAQGEWKVDLLQHLVSRHEPVQAIPGISKSRLPLKVARPGGVLPGECFATRPETTEDQK